jgi:hypothetical protein
VIEAPGAAASRSAAASADSVSGNPAASHTVSIPSISTEVEPGLTSARPPINSDNEPEEIGGSEPSGAAVAARCGGAIATVTTVVCGRHATPRATATANNTGRVRIVSNPS